MTGSVIEVPEIFRADIRELVVFPVAPEIFDGIEFRRVRRKVFDGNLAAERIEELADQPAAVRREPVPHH